MKRKCMAVSILVLVSAVGFVGCKKAEPPSPIVKMMEDAGSGDVSKTSDENRLDGSINISQSSWKLRKSASK